MQQKLAGKQEFIRTFHRTNCQQNFKTVCHDKEYLGYILTREGIKPQQKVQAILALKLPNNVKKLRHFLGMVQYYRDMCARCH